MQKLLDAVHSPIFHLILLAAFLVAGIAGCPKKDVPSTPEGKPMAPIDITIEPDAAPAANATVPLVVRVTPRVPAPSIEITIDLPERVRAVSGETQWSGSLSAGESHELRFTVQLPSKGVVDITAWAKAGRGFVRGKTYSVDLGGEAQKPAPEYKTGSHGEKILEVPLH